MDSLEQWFTSHAADVEQWLLDQESGLTLPVYLSVDIRDAGYKAAVVDANVFPAGWNNVPEEGRLLATQAFRDYMARHFPGIGSVGIIPENHTRNTFYFDNLAALLKIVREAGFKAEITHLNPELAHDVSTFEGSLTDGSTKSQVTLLKLKRHGDELRATSFEPELFLLNTDLAQGLPEELRGISQPLIPHPLLGWHKRRKSCHYKIVRRLAEDLGKAFNLDPWLVTTIFFAENNVDFKSHVGLDRVAEKTQEIINVVQGKYTEYHVEDHVCVFVKDDSGTYGQAVMHVSNADQILHMNRKTLNKMDIGKGSKKVAEVVVQECVPTRFVKDSKHSAETGEAVMYMMGDTVVGGFARMNTEQGPHDNLNSKGMYFASLESLGNTPMSIYRFLTRLSRVAVGHEMKEAC